MEEKKRPVPNGSHKAASKKKTSNVSYRSARPASWKQADSSVKSGKSNRERRTENETRNTLPVKNQTDSGNHTGNHAVRKPHRKKRGCLPKIIGALVIVLIVFAVFHFSLKAAFNKVKKYVLDTEQITVNANDENISDYQNIALFGVDSQDNQIHDKGSRTDCIIIASINKHNKKVKLMSIYRDTYVSIDGNYDKINAAYSYGGPELAISTINRNLDLNITDFATVNFKALADAVDIVGGIKLTVKSQKELENLNDYIHNMNNINGGDSPKFDEPDSYPFTATFDGNQAVAYSRIRYMEGGDHERANHQRLVIQGLVDAVKKKPWTINKIVNTVLPQCKTSLSSSEMTKLSTGLLRYKIADSQAYPFHSVDEKYDGIYYGFPLSVSSNVVQAHEYLFGTKNYEPTEELGLISEKVKVKTDELGYDSE